MASPIPMPASPYRLPVAPPELEIRTARPADATAIERVARRAVRGIASGWYSRPQVAALLAMPVYDPQLLRDGTFFVVEADERVVGCGGWSFRPALLGASAERAPRREPARDAAAMRSFFVDPGFARRGLARRLLERAEAEAWTAGFRRAELLATLCGEPFYRASGYRVVEATSVSAGGGITLPAARMEKRLGPPEPPGGFGLTSWARSC